MTPEECVVLLRDPTTTFDVQVAGTQHLPSDMFKTLVVEYVTNDERCVALLRTRRGEVSSLRDTTRLFRLRSLFVCRNYICNDRPASVMLEPTIFTTILNLSRVDTAAKLEFLFECGITTSMRNIRLWATHDDSGVRAVMAARTPLVAVQLVRLPPRVVWHVTDGGVPQRIYIHAGG